MRNRIRIRIRIQIHNSGYGWGEGARVHSIVSTCVQLSLGRMSVADPGYLTRIPDPDFYPFRIPDPGSRIPDPGSRIPDPGTKTATKERGEKKFIVKPFFVATNFTRLQINLFFKC
jgi:hypothetical protein